MPALGQGEDFLQKPPLFPRRRLNDFFYLFFYLFNGLGCRPSLSIGNTLEMHAPVT